MKHFEVDRQAPQKPKSVFVYFCVLKPRIQSLSVNEGRFVYPLLTSRQRWWSLFNFFLVACDTSLWKGGGQHIIHGIDSGRCY